MDLAELLTGSLNPLGFIGLIMPAWGSNHEMFCYIGAGGLIAVIVAVGGMQKERNSFFWTIVFFLSCFIALGENLPGSDIISVIPLISLGRIPARAMFLAGLASSVMIGMLFEGLQQGSVKFKIINYLGFGFIVFGATVLGYGSYQGSKILQNTWWSAIIFCGVGGALFAVKHHRFRKAALIVLFFLINVDYMYSNIASIDWRYEPRDRIGRAIADLGSGIYRIYSPSFSLTQISAVKNGLEITDGVDPMQLESYQEFMETASGVPYQKYSVSIPPFSSGEPDQDNAGYKPDPEQLGLLNVKYLVSNFPLEDPKLKFIREIEGEYIYENKQFKPRAWVEGQKNEIKPADVLLNSPNRIEIFGTGPGNLVISEINYPGWRVIVNGEEREIKETYRLLRSVALDPGSNRITFIYRPGLVLIGLMISVLGFVFVFWQILRLKRE
jgi:hypothetical protein